MKFIDLTLQRFGRLTVIEFVGFNTSKRPRPVWRCLCDCGSFAIICTDSLRAGNTRSCGCLRREIVSKLGKKFGPVFCGSNKVHGESNSTVEYKTWRNMFTRCRNQQSPNYPDYGGRGITVCDRWLDYQNFLNDMGRRPFGKTSIDRIDPNGNYEPGNCRWADWSEQNRNRRKRKAKV